MKRFSTVAISFMLSVSTGGCAKSSREPIKIGAIYNLEGAQASLDIPSANGAKLAVKEVNQKGGISGRALKLIIYDGKTDPETIKKWRTPIFSRRVHSPPLFPGHGYRWISRRDDI